MVMNGTLSDFLISGLLSFKVSFLGIDSIALEIWLSRNCFCALVSVSNVLVQLIWYRRSHLLNKYVVNGEQGLRGLIFSCDKDDLKRVVSIGVYRWVSSISHFLFFHFREGF